MNNATQQAEEGYPYDEDTWISKTRIDFQRSAFTTGAAWQQRQGWVKAEDELPEGTKEVLGLENGKMYTVFYARKGVVDVELEDADESSIIDGDGCLIEGWYEIMENVGHYDAFYQNRRITHWHLLPALPEE